MMVYEMCMGNVNPGSPGTGVGQIRALRTADIGEGAGVNGLEWRSL